MKLKWSSRESLCAQLLSVLQSIPLEGPHPHESTSTSEHYRKLALYYRAHQRAPRRQSTRGHCIDLLARCAGPEQRGALREFLLDDREAMTARSSVLDAAVSLGLELTPGEFAGLLDEAVAARSWGNNLSLGELLSLARTEESCVIAEQALTRATAKQRVEVLLHSRGSPLHARLQHLLHARWLAEDQETIRREDPDRDLEVSVALATWEQPGSWDVLVRLAHEEVSVTLMDHVREGLPTEAFVRWARLRPKLYRQAAETLRLPLPELRAHFPVEDLRERLRHAATHQRLFTYVLDGVPAKRSENFPFAARLLAEWTEERPLLLSLLRHPDVAEHPRRALLAALLLVDRPAAIQWARESPGTADLPTLVRQLLHEVARAPRPEERPFFLEVLQGTDDVASCFALEALLALGGVGDTAQERVETLKRSTHPGLRVRAMAAQVRDGKREDLPELVRLAREAPEPWLRAEALRWLCEVDREAGQPCVEQALSDDSAWGDVPLAAAEALHALAKRGTPEDLSLLLNASVAVLETFSSAVRYSSYTFFQMHYLVDGSLQHHLARDEGREHGELPLPSVRAFAFDILAQARTPAAQPSRHTFPSALFEPWSRREWDLTDT
ncbi:HEAT repeat domain-containing protein [Myxococcus stipitatus]|uniref:HEAT repeat domain-containing protein n=1 Tax=Myxococcus stipitatus TaxID=83455 RepID=UPI00314539C3